MSRFLGKFSFFNYERMLVYFGNRAGLISKDRITIHDSAFNVQPLPPEASKFLAYDTGNGEFELRAYNGEVLCLGGGDLPEISTVGTLPTGYPRFQEYYAPARFLLAPLRQARASGSWTAALHFTVKSRRRGDVGGFLVPSTVDANRLREYDYMKGLIATNIESSPNTPAVWQFVQYADGVDEIQSAKKVKLFDFSPVGKAVVDMSGQELREIDLGRSDFRGANFSNATLFKCVTDGARFEKANFDGAKILGGYFYATEFSDVSMRGTTLNNLSGKGCNFTRVDMSTVDAPLPMGITSTEQYRTRFTQGKVSVKIIGRIWSWMMLDDAEIEGVEQIPEDREFRANNANLSGVDLSKLKCKYADFSNAEMHGTRMSGAQLPGAKFLGAKLDGDGTHPPADLVGAQLPEAKFQNAQLSGVAFQGARLDQANFDGTTILDADFSNAYLESVSFAGVEQKLASGATFNRAFLGNCDFRGVDLSSNKGARRASLAEAYLHGANLSGAQLAGTLLSGAGIPTEPGELTVRLGDLPPLPFPYEPTILDPSQATNQETVCPSGAKGPCEGDKLKPQTPFPSIWPWPRGQGNPGDPA